MVHTNVGAITAALSLPRGMQKAHVMMTRSKCACFKED